MSGIFGLNVTSIIATAALGPAGGMGAMLANQLAASMGQSILSQLGQQFGLPQQAMSLIDNAFQTAAGSGFPQGERLSLADTVADVGNKMGASPSEIGEQQRVAEDFVNDFVKQARDNADEADVGTIGRGNGKGWLMAMATALGNQLDKMGAEMEDMASRITKDSPKLSAQFGVITQQFSMLMNATTNAIKTVGESMGNAARKG